MQIQSRFKGLLAILISLLFIWGLFCICSLFLKSSINTNLKYFPKDAEITIRLDGKKLVENVAYDLLCVSKDQPVIDKLINYVTQESKDGNVKKIGIDFLSEIGVFVKPVKNVFAKFKNYNKDTNIHAAVVPADRPTAAKQTKPQEEKIVKERANRYSFEGKLVNFNFLKKVDRKVVDKRYAVSFAEFKKMQKNQ